MWTRWDIAHPAVVLPFRAECGPAALGRLRRAQSSRGPIVVQAFQPARAAQQKGCTTNAPATIETPRLHPASDRQIAKAPHLSHGLPFIAPPTPRRTRTSGPPIAPAACDTPRPPHRLSHPIAAAFTHPELAAISTLRQWLRSSLRRSPNPFLMRPSVLFRTQRRIRRSGSRQGGATTNAPHHFCRAESRNIEIY